MEIKQENLEVVKGDKIDWGAFDENTGKKYFKEELGKKYAIGFSSITQSTRMIEEEGKEQKEVPCLVIGVDYLDGQWTELTYSVTSKKHAKQFKEFLENEMLFKKVFSLEKTGTGFQTSRQMYPTIDKPKKPEVKK